MRWATLLEQNDKALPRFPLPLGIEDDQYARSATITLQLLDREQALRLDSVCVETGTKFVSAVLTAAAVTYHDMTRRPFFLGLTPKSTRTTYRELNTVGWFASLVPYSTHIEHGSTFRHLLMEVNGSYRVNRSLSDVSLHKVVELLPDEFDIAADWVAPMVSFIDVRRLPGASMFDHVNFGVYGNRGCSEEVYTWVNRFDAYTTITMLYPDTPTAQRSVREYLHHFTRVLHVTASAGDYAVQQTIEP